MKSVSLFFLLLLSTSFILSMAQRTETSLKDPLINQKEHPSLKPHNREKKHIFDVPINCPQGQKADRNGLCRKIN